MVVTNAMFQTRLKKLQLDIEALYNSTVALKEIFRESRKSIKHFRAKISAEQLRQSKDTEESIDSRIIYSEHRMQDKLNDVNKSTKPLIKMYNERYYNFKCLSDLISFLLMKYKKNIECLNLFSNRGIDKSSYLVGSKFGIDLEHPFNNKLKDFRAILTVEKSSNTRTISNLKFIIDNASFQIDEKHRVQVALKNEKNLRYNDKKIDERGIGGEESENENETDEELKNGYNEKIDEDDTDVKATDVVCTDQGKTQLEESKTVIKEKEEESEEESEEEAEEEVEDNTTQPINTLCTNPKQSDESELSEETTSEEESEDERPLTIAETADNKANAKDVESPDIEPEEEAPNTKKVSSGAVKKTEETKVDTPEVKAIENVQQTEKEKKLEREVAEKSSNEKFPTSVQTGATRKGPQGSFTKTPLSRKSAGGKPFFPAQGTPENPQKKTGAAAMSTKATPSPSSAAANKPKSKTQPYVGTQRGSNRGRNK